MSLVSILVNEIFFQSCKKKCIKYDYIFMMLLTNNLNAPIFFENTILYIYTHK